MNESTFLTYYTIVKTMQYILPPLSPRNERKGESKKDFIIYSDIMPARVYMGARNL
jgi:hypothetical protein